MWNGALFDEGYRDVRAGKGTLFVAYIYMLFMLLIVSNALEAQRENREWEMVDSP